MLYFSDTALHDSFSLHYCYSLNSHLSQVADLPFEPSNNVRLSEYGSSLRLSNPHAHIPSLCDSVSVEVLLCASEYHRHGFVPLSIEDLLN